MPQDSEQNSEHMHTLFMPKTLQFFLLQFLKLISIFFVVVVEIQGLF